MITGLRKQGRTASRCAAFFNLRSDCGGGSAAEFALVLPVLALLLFAIIQFGIAFNNYIVLSSGVAAGARQLAISRGSATAYTDTVSAINSAAPTLTSFSAPRAGQSVALRVAGTTCTAANQASACANAFTAGGSAQVIATYPCNVDVLWIKFGPCTLSSSATEFIQ